MIDQVDVQDQTFETQNQARGQNQQRVARNASIYMIVQIISLCVTFVGLSIVPRCLGETISGQLVLAGATVQIVFNFGNLCLETFLIREIGRDTSQADTLVRATLGLRLTTIVMLFAATYLSLRALHAAPIVMTYGLLYFPVSFIFALSDPLRSVLAGYERAREVSISDLSISGAPILAIPFLLYGARFAPQKAEISAFTLIGLTLVMQVITLVVRVGWLRGVVTLRPIFDVRIWLRLIRGGIPFMLNNYVGVFYSYITLLVLNHFMNAAAVGEYNQVNRLLGGFMFLPAVLTAALLPVLARMATGDPKAFDDAKGRVLIVLIISCMPVITGMILLAHPLCLVLYGAHKFVHVAQALQFTALLLLPLYIVSTIYQFLVAQNRNGIWSFVLLGTVILHTALAWVLVPYTMRTLHNGILGATFAMTIAEGIAMGFAFGLVQINPFAPIFLGRVLRGATATGIMALVTWALREGIGYLRLPFAALAFLQLSVPALLGACVFLLAAGMLHAFPPQEQELVVGALKRRLRRIT
jgi:O-antigen/teichoic acid export membrane protein